jgi:regulator of replication initiation timing
MKQKKTKLTYKDMIKILSGFDRQIQTLYTELHGIKFLLNSYLDMNKDVDKLTEFVEEKIGKEKDASAKREKKQAKGSRATKTSSKPS